MKKTYEMQNNPEFPQIENNFQNKELHHKYLEEECLIPEYNPNFNVNIFIPAQLVFDLILSLSIFNLK